MHLLEDKLKEIYRAENALVQALPKMIENSSCSQLIDALTSHLQETKLQVAHLEEVFINYGKKAAADKCEAISALILEAETIINDCEEGSIRDEKIISTAEKIQHYEIETYGTLRQFSDLHGMHETIQLLKANFEVEKATKGNLNNEEGTYYSESL